MNNLLGNLRRGERILVIVVAAVVLLVLNFVFVTPRFSDWGQVRNSIATGQSTILAYDAKIRQDTAFRNVLKQLQKDGQNIPSTDNDIQLQKTIMSKASQFGVTVNNYFPMTINNQGDKNAFFEEQSMRINVESGETNFDFPCGQARPAD